MTDTNNGSVSAPAAHEATSTLTWQQQLLKESQGRQKKEKRPQEKRATKPKSTNTKPKPKDRAPEHTAPTLTWQQELFNQAQRPGATFDYAADERDLETFGGGKSRGNGATGTPDRRRGKGKMRNDAKLPSTPNKKALPSLAYAGPTFHNSPAAASLPAPKFPGKSKLAQNEDPSALPDRSISPGPLPASVAPPSDPKVCGPVIEQSNTPADDSLSSSSTSAPQQPYSTPASSMHPQSKPNEGLAAKQAQQPPPAVRPPSQVAPVASELSQSHDQYASDRYAAGQQIASSPASVHPPSSQYFQYPYPPGDCGPYAHTAGQHVRGPNHLSPSPRMSAVPGPASQSPVNHAPAASTQAKSSPVPPTASATQSSSSAPRSNFQSVDNLLASMLNSSSLFRR